MALFKCAGKDRLDDDDNPICDYEAPRRWSGRCPKCKMPYNIVRVGAEKKREKATVTLSEPVDDIVRIPTGVEQFDEVIGGGLVDGKVILIGGKRGSGKTTLLLMLAYSYATAKRRVLYASAEENSEVIRQTAKRISTSSNDHVSVMGNAYDLDDIFEQARETAASLIIVDSLPAVTEGLHVDGGSAALRGIQVIAEVNKFCEKYGTCAIVTNHVNRAGEFAGSTTVEHFVAAILAFFPYNPSDDGKLRNVIVEEESRRPDLEPKNVRVLFCDGKNRIGPGDEKRYYEMTSNGLRPLKRKTSILQLLR